jgi:hypothetical protein
MNDNCMKHRIAFLLKAAAVWLLALEAAARPDYYTSGFYTRGSDAAMYIDQGGVLDPFYIPMQEWSFIPRVTLAATKDDNYFMTQDNQESGTSIDLIPGALLMYGRPDHNHLYVDAGVAIPVAQSGAADKQNAYFVTAGGVKATGMSEVYGRVGHRRMENEDVVIGERIVEEDYTGDVGVEHRISTKSSLGANGQVELHDYGSDEYLNYNRYYGAGRFYHRMTEKSEWFLQAGAGMDDLDEELAGVYSDATFYDLSVGMRGKPSPKTAVSGRVGYRWRTFDDTSISDVSGWIANIGAEATPFGFSRFYTELLSDIRPDITKAGDSVIDKRWTTGVNRRLFTERLRGDASVLFGNVEEYGPNSSSDYDYWGYALWLDYWTRWNLSFGAGYSYTEKLSSSGSSSAYEAGQFMLRMSWNY